MNGSEEIELDKNKKHSIEVVIDRVVVKEGYRQLVWQTPWKSALRLGGGKVIIDVMVKKNCFLVSIMLVHIVVSPLENLSRACFHLIVRLGRATCDGLGTKLEVDQNLVIPNYDLTLRETCNCTLGANKFTILSSSS